MPEITRFVTEYRPLSLNPHTMKSTGDKLMYVIQIPDSMLETPTNAIAIPSAISIANDGRDRHAVLLQLTETVVAKTLQKHATVNAITSTFINQF